jgi:hypothetical protein
MTLAQLEHRLATVERELAALTGRVKASPSPEVNAWIDEIHGSFQDDASYRQAARLGRQWRKSGRSPATRARKASSK